MLYTKIDGKMNFNDREPQQTKIIVGPTKDMHEIEYWEDKLDSFNISHALLEMRKVTKKVNIFQGYVLIAEESIPVLTRGSANE